MKHLIPKQLTSWAPLNYRSPGNSEPTSSKPVTSTLNKGSYDLPDPAKELAQQMGITENKAREILAETARKNQTTVYSDDREDYLREHDQTSASLELERLLKKELQDRALSITDDALKYTFPSTWIGAAFNDDGTCQENLIRGDGFGNDAGNFAFDLALPLLSGGINLASNTLNKAPLIRFYRGMPSFAKKAYFKDMKNTIIDHFSTLNSAQPLQLDFTNVKNSKWYSAIKNTYGEDFANNVVEKMNAPEFKLYFIGNDPIKAASEIDRFNQGMDIYSKLAGDPNYGMGVVQGSAALSANGTVHRASAAPHDLDFKANIKDASRQTIDINDREKVGEALRVLFRNEDEAITDSPIFNLFRRLFGGRPYINIPAGTPRWAVPKSRNNAFYLTRMFGISEPYGVHRLVLTDVNGYPLDFFMTDQPIKMSLNKYGLGTEGEPLYWKLKWSERSVPRPKDVHDLNEYVPFSDANPIIDIANNDHNYSPFMFGDRILSKEGFPIIKDIETYPGSGIKVPVTMNWKGEWKILGDPKIDENLLLESWKQGGKLK